MKVVFGAIEEVLAGGEGEDDHDQVQERVPEGDFVLDEETGGEFLVGEVGLFCGLLVLQDGGEEALQEDGIDVVFFVDL